MLLHYIIKHAKFTFVLIYNTYLFYKGSDVVGMKTRAEKHKEIYKKKSLILHFLLL